MDVLLNGFTLFIKEFIVLFSEMAPFLLFGFLLAGVIHVWIPNRLYVPKISKPTFKSVLWAALFGVPLPICSCGVIPTAIALRREGASKGASVSFLISTPATGVDSIFATYSLLGFPFAVLRPIAAFATALFGGVLTNFMTCNEKDVKIKCFNENEQVRVAKTSKSCNCCGNENSDDCCASHKHSKFQNDSFVSRLKKMLHYGFVEMVSNVAKWLCVGLVLGSLITAFVPNDFFLTLREYPILCMLAVLILAMPMYTCATGSIPLALALVAKGITPGAALVLLMAGPATSFASMLIVGKTFGKKTLAAYLISIVVGVILFGLIVDSFFMETFLFAMFPNGIQNSVDAYCETNGIFDYVCGGLLALLIFYSKCPFLKKKHSS